MNCFAASISKTADHFWQLRVSFRLTLTPKLSLRRQPAFIVDQCEAARQSIAPVPQDEIEIVIGRAGGEAPDEQTPISGCNKPTGEGLCLRFPGRLHLAPPGRVGERSSK